MKNILLLSLVTLLSWSSFAQNAPEVKPCGQVEQTERLLNERPELRGIYEANQAALHQNYLDHFQNAQEGERVVYTIPVVFHVIHEGGVENISDDQILDALAILNRDFRGLNADLNNVQAEFAGITADIEVEFALAKKDNGGNCFYGITRTFSSATNGSGNEQVTAVVNSHGNFPGDKYLNIFIVNYASDAAGYTYRPSTWWSDQMNGGIFILHQYVGSIGTGTSVRSRSLTHEVGHWLNLAHTWGNTNEPGVGSNCTDDDDIIDTPNTIGWTSCSLAGESCGDKDNVENYMEYSYCSKMFTTGQRNYMRAALNSSQGGRNNLWTASNLNATGVNSAPILCTADFESNVLEICAGTPVQFTDRSFDNVTTWSWDFGPNATPSTSTDQNPSVVFNQAGTYNVSLTVGDGVSSKSTTKNNYITVSGGIGKQPVYNESFETITLAGDGWSIENGNWDITSSAAVTGAKSLKLTNYNASAGSKYAIITPALDVTNYTDNPVLNFKYAFKKKQSSNTDNMIVKASADCGVTWTNVRIISSSSLSSSDGFSFSNWAPTSAAEWKNQNITLFPNNQVANLRIKFELTNGGGNNLYIEDINIQGTLSMNERNIFSKLLLSPNPAQNYVNVDYNLNSTANSFTYEVLDLSGRVLASYSEDQMQMQGSFQIPLDQYTSGYYFIRFNVDGLVFSKKIIKE